MCLDLKTVRHEIIPQPLAIRPGSGSFSLTAETRIEAEGAAQEVGNYLAEVLSAGKGNQAGGRIVLSVDSARGQLGEEGYAISIKPNVIDIRACRQAGLFYGCQTLLQLLRDDRTIPCMEMEDRPRFRWRGLMLDVARHFFSVEFIKRTIDLLARYKMNRLHLHLTDAQAWRLEISNYPLLTKPLKKEEFPAAQEGYYTHDDIRGIVSYAKLRGVMVVPEIEFPSHSDLVLTSYPQFLCATFDPHQAGWNPKEYCPGSEKVFTFIGEVFSEVTTLFDAPFIHIGGDEYLGMSWEKCPDCRRRIEAEELDREDSSELQALFSKCMGSRKKYLLYRYMMRRIARMVVDRNRVPILWDDLSWQGNYPDKSVAVQWHYQGLLDYVQQTTTLRNPSIVAATAGHDAIIASATHLYFDYFDGGRVLQRLYEFEPVPAELADDLSGRIFGPQACLWECPQERVDSMLFPRLLALAEMGWTDKSLRNWNDFSVRLDAHIPELARRGVHGAAMPNQEELSMNGITEEWKPSPFKECFFNDVVKRDGTYEARVELGEPKGSITIEKAVWTQDGHEKPMEVLESGDEGCKIYRFAISNVKTEILYGVRLYFKIDGKPNGPIKVRVRLVGESHRDD